MRYIRMYKGSEDGAPGVTLYEIDSQGWVHRQLQVHTDGVRFSPEDILLRRPVSVGYMAMHPDAEEIDAAEFELHWAEFDHRRGFRERLPNPWRAWQGQLYLACGVLDLQWLPSGTPDEPGWIRVPGFVRLWIRGEHNDAWTAQRELFLGTQIAWSAMPQTDHDVRFGPAREVVVDGPGLAAAFMANRNARERSMYSVS